MTNFIRCDEDNVGHLPEQSELGKTIGTKRGF